jgi:hypothetical protein
VPPERLDEVREEPLREDFAEDLRAEALREELRDLLEELRPLEPDLDPDPFLACAICTSPSVRSPPQVRHENCPHTGTISC